MCYLFISKTSFEVGHILNKKTSLSGAIDYSSTVRKISTQILKTQRKTKSKYPYSELLINQT